MIGKSVFIWQTEAIYGGDAGRIAAALKTAGFESAILHSTNLSAWRTLARIALVPALKNAGVQPYGGAAVYGQDPTGEGQRAAAICREFGLPGFVFDAEGAFDAVPNSNSNAVKLLWAFRSGVPAETLAGWCWWAFHHAPGETSRHWHPRSVLSAAMSPQYGDADFGVPMMYWSWGDDAISAVKYLNESWAQWREVTDKPLCPAGRAYIGDGGTARPDAVQAFGARARELGAKGFTWWSLQHALDESRLPGVWKALRDLPAFGHVQPEPKPIPQPTHATVIATALNMRPQPRVDASLGILGQLFNGTQVDVREVVQTNRQAWARISLEAWVCVDNHGQVLAEVR